MAGLLTATMLIACSWPFSEQETRDEPPDDRPNVLLVSLDTLRADHLPFYGYERDTAPFMSKLASEGMLFTTAYSQSSSTAPTHASMFTGLHAPQHGYYSVRFELSDAQTTLAEVMKDAGFRTFSVASSIRFVPETGFPQGFDHYTRIEGAKVDRGPQVTRQALEWANEDSATPFFAFVHYFDAHAPYAAPEGFRTLWHPGLDSPQPGKTAAFIKEYREDPDAVSPEQLDYLRALYDAEIRYLDTHIEALVAGLPEDRPTLVVITSDHGEGFHEHGYLGHSDYVYEELVRVPLLFWGAGVPAGSSEMPAQTVDLMPTILEHVGIEVPEGLAGQSLKPLFSGGEVDRSDGDLVFVQTPKRWGITKTLPTGRFKLDVRLAGQQKASIYRLDQDPQGMVDVSLTYPQEKDALLLEMAAWDFEDAHGRAVERPEVPEEELKQLEALGYIE